MAHFAELDENNIVLRVIVVSDDNTRGGVHYAPNSQTPDDGVALRKNYAGVGSVFDEVRDAFMSPQPYPSWTLDEDTCWWEPPIPRPSSDTGGYYGWDEPTLNWVYIPYS